MNKKIADLRNPSRVQLFESVEISMDDYVRWQIGCIIVAWTSFEVNFDKAIASADRFIYWQRRFSEGEEYRILPPEKTWDRKLVRYSSFVNEYGDSVIKSDWNRVRGKISSIKAQRDAIAHGHINISRDNENVVVSFHDARADWKHNEELSEIHAHMRDTLGRREVVEKWRSHLMKEGKRFTLNRLLQVKDHILKCLERFREVDLQLNIRLHGAQSRAHTSYKTRSNGTKA